MYLTFRIILCFIVFPIDIQIALQSPYVESYKQHPGTINK